jgi:hypothetical protein
MIVMGSTKLVLRDSGLKKIDCSYLNSNQLEDFTKLCINLVLCQRHRLAIRVFK